MPTYHDIVTEMKTIITDESGNEKEFYKIDEIRRKYIKLLSDSRDRATICYYANFNQKGNGGISIADDDIQSLMPLIHKIGNKKSKGVDLILHTLGGEVAATERIINYLTEIFDNNVQVFIPQLAMSAGTMLACLGEKIYMGKQSHLGPADPSFSDISTVEIIDLFDKTKESFAKNKDKEYYEVLISKYPPHFYSECLKALKLAEQIVIKCLKKHNNPKSIKIAKFLLNKNKHLLHARGITRDDLKKNGLNIVNLEDDNTLQDTILSIHHSFIITMQLNNNIKKIMENQEGVAMIKAS
jgi:hypothetical protein